MKYENELTTLYIFSDVLGNIKPKFSLKIILIKICQETTAWNELERYLVPPGVEGSKSFDQMRVVDILREHDVDKVLIKLPGRYVWDQFVIALRSSGFLMQHGRVTGLIQRISEPTGTYDKPDDNSPDIE